jgi:hypothetical protein
MIDSQWLYRLRDSVSGDRAGTPRRSSNMWTRSEPTASEPTAKDVAQFVMAVVLPKTRVCFTFGAGWCRWHRGRGKRGPDAMKALANWTPAPYLNVVAGERKESRWLVTMCSRERAYCPLCGVQSSSRHSVHPQTLGDLALPNPFRELRARSRVRLTAWRGSSGCSHY